MEPVECDDGRRADFACLIEPTAERARLHPHLRGQNFLAEPKVDQAQRPLP
jgi:hypothetical protein